MGGAFASLSDDVTGIIFNPAGLAFGNWKFDAGGTNNRVDNREADITGTGEGYGVPYNFVFYAAAARLGNWVIGAGISSPYTLKQDFNTYSSFSTTVQSFSLQILSTDVMVARRFGEFLSIGIAGHNETLKESYDSSTTGHFEDSSTNNYFNGGISYRTKTYGLGIAFTPERKLSINTAMNNNISPNVFFRDVVIPQKTTLGGFYRLSEKILTSIDIDFVGSVKNAIYVGTGVNSYAPEIYLDSESHTIIHGGFEWTLVNQREATVIWRAGAYHEPSRLATSRRDRDHYTLGLEVHFGPAVLGVAFDQATDFNNTSQGFSISVGSI